jgi:hypothetical protein
MNTFILTFNEKGEIIGGNNLYLGNIRQYSDKTYSLKVIVPSTFNATLKVNVERPDGSVSTYAIPYVNNEYKITFNNWVSDLSGEVKLTVTGTSGTTPNEQVFIFGLATLYCEYSVKPSTYAGDIPTGEYDQLLTLINSKVNKSTTVNNKALNTNIVLSLADLVDDVGYATDGDVSTAIATRVPTTRTINAKPLSADVVLKTSDLENDSNFITSVSGFATINDIPTKTSELTNDSGFAGSLDLKDVFKNASLTYTASNGNLVLAFTKYDNSTLTLATINLPTELIVTSGSYDANTKELVLVLANSTPQTPSEIRIPVGALYNTYFGDNLTIEGFVDTNDGNKDKFRIKSDWVSTNITTPLGTKLGATGDGKDVTITFTLPSTYTAPTSNETLATIIGKIAKRLSTLGTLADKSSITSQELPVGIVIDSTYVKTDNNFTNALKTSYDQAVTNSHTHTNKSTLDGIAGVLTEIPATPGATEGYLATVGAIRVLYDNPDLSWDGDAETLNNYPSDLEANGGTIPVRDVDGAINVTGVNVSGQDITWNADYGTFNMSLLNEQSIKVGQEILYYAKNGTVSDTIEPGSVIQFAGIQGDHILIKPANRVEINANPNLIMGVAKQFIFSGDFGYVTHFGIVDNLQMSNEPGSILYYDSRASAYDGGFTTEEVSPFAKIQMAVVVKSSTGEATNGRILVRPTIIKEPITFNEIMYSEGWITGEEEGQFAIYILDVSGIKETDNPIVDIDLSGDPNTEDTLAIINYWSNIIDIIALDGLLIIRALAIPELPIPFKLKVVR